MFGVVMSICGLMSTSPEPIWLRAFRRLSEGGWFGGDLRLQGQASCADRTLQTQRIWKPARRPLVCIPMTILHLWKLERCGGFRSPHCGGGPVVRRIQSIRIQRHPCPQRPAVGCELCGATNEPTKEEFQRNLDPHPTTTESDFVCTSCATCFAIMDLGRLLRRVSLISSDHNGRPCFG